MFSNVRYLYPFVVGRYIKRQKNRQIKIEFLKFRNNIPKALFMNILVSTTTQTPKICRTYTVESVMMLFNTG